MNFQLPAPVRRARRNRECIQSSLLPIFYRQASAWPGWALYELWRYTLAMTFLRRVVTVFCSRKSPIASSIVLLALFSLARPARAFAAASPDLETVLTGSRQRIEKLDYRATGHLTGVAADGTRTSYKFVAKAHWFPDGLRLLCDISGPGTQKTTILLHMTVNGHLTIEALLPGQTAPGPVPFEHWSDRLAGTDFSYEDMVEAQFFWKNQQLLPPQKYGARDCV